MSNPQDVYGTNYVMNRSIKPEFDVDDSRWTGDVKFTLKKGDSGYYPALASLSDDVSKISRQDDAIKVSYQTPSEGKYGIKDFALTETYQLSEDGTQMNWSIDIQNTSGEGLVEYFMATAVLENENRTKTEISNAYKTVADAIAGMQVRGNKAALEAAILMAEDILKMPESI